MGKSKRQLADEAWLRSEAQRAEAVPEGTLVGQIDLVSGTVAGAGKEEEAFTSAPANCPSCQKRMTVQHGWAVSSHGPYLQCGFCGHMLPVTPEAHEETRKQIAHHFEQFRLARIEADKAKTKRGPRVRGAG